MKTQLITYAFTLVVLILMTADISRAQKDSNQASNIAKLGDFELLISQQKVLERKEGKRDEHGDRSKVWQPVVVTVTLKSNQETSITFVKTLDEYDIEIIAADSEGTAVTRTLYGKHLQSVRHPPLGVSPLSIAFHPLEPRDTLTSVVNVSRRYDLSLPGTYFIQARRKLSTADGSESWLTSNKLEIDIE